MRHQRTDLTPSKSKQTQHSHKHRSKNQQRYSSEHKNERPPFKKFDPNQAHKRRDICSECGGSKHVESFKCPARKFHCKTCNKYGHFTNLCYKRKVSFKSRTPKAHQLQAGTVYMKEDSICGQSSDLTSSDESFCLQVIQCTQANTKIPTPHHLITNLAYRLKPYHKGNQYLRARLDTCTNVNIIPASVCKLVFQDPDCKKLASSKLEIGTYTTDTVKWVDSCMFYLVHPDTKHLQDVTFYVASNNGSVLLSCARTLALGLIQPHTRLDYLPPRASLNTSSADHPKKTGSKSVCMFPKKESEVPSHKGMVCKLITGKGQILAHYLDVFDGIGCFLGPPYHIQVDPSVTPKQTPCLPIPVHLKEVFKKEIDKML